MKTIRAFIAVPLSAAIKTLLQQMQERLANPGLQVLWVRPDTMHLTVKFLGETAEALIPQIIEALRGAAAEVPAFTLTLTEVGAFPNLNYPRVLWVGWKNESASLATLHARLEERLAALGIERDARPFAPHLTLGRVKSVQRKGSLLRQVHAAQQGFHAEVHVDSCALFRSELNPTGAIHTLVENVALLGSN